MKIENSARLSYQLMTIDDAQLLFDLDQDPEVLRYIPGADVPSMQDIYDVSVPRMQSYTNEAEGWGLWKVTTLSGNSGENADKSRFIGWVLVRPMDFFSDTPKLDDLELGWRFKRDSWGKGYATEAALSIKTALIAKGNIKRLSSIALEDNAASVSIMKKLGLNYIKTETHKDPLFESEVVFYHLDV